MRLVRSPALTQIPGIAHAFSTRLGEGRADFDLGPADGASAEIEKRRDAFLRAADLEGARPAILRQVHGAAIVEAAPDMEQPTEADGAYRPAGSVEGAPVPAVRTADCVAVLLAHREGRAVAAVHAGWRGVAAGIAARAVRKFAADGLTPAGVVAALGPAILGCCYEVGDEVVAALAAACGDPSGFVGVSRSARRTVDLHAALAAQLTAAGVPAGSIDRAPYCTRCRNDLFFSYRAEGSRAGRLMAAIGPAGRTLTPP